MNLYDNIKRLRTMQGMSQEELAKKVGYNDRSSIAKIESGSAHLLHSFKNRIIVRFFNTLVNFWSTFAHLLRVCLLQPTCNLLQPIATKIKTARIYPSGCPN